MATYVIGDVQGCYDELVELMNLIKFDRIKDKLIFVGDLINRGPKSLETLRLIKSLGSSAKVVLGNHDLTFLARSYGYLPKSKKNTFESILEAPDLNELREWLCQQKLLIKYKKNIITHAGIPPIFSTKTAQKLAEELEFVLSRPTTRKLFLANLFGNEPDIWCPTLEGVNRWRCIANYFTRMRICDVNGRLNFKYTSGDSDVPEGWKPWFKIKNKHLKKNETIIFGHWAALCGKTGNDKFIAVDTGCVWGNTLTAYSPKKKKRYEVKSFSEVVEF